MVKKMFWQISMKKQTQEAIMALVVGREDFSGEVEMMAAAMKAGKMDSGGGEKVFGST